MRAPRSPAPGFGQIRAAALGHNPARAMVRSPSPAIQLVDNAEPDRIITPCDLVGYAERTESNTMKIELISALRR